jgi:hypothetical protein
MGAPLLGRIIHDESTAGSLKEQALQFACGLEILRHPSLSAMDGVSIEVKDEIAHDTKHSDREANAPCFAEGCVSRQTDSREEGEEGVEEGGEMIGETGGYWRKPLTVAIVALTIIAVGVGLLYLHGMLDAWRRVRYGSILFSLSRYATVGACAFAIYYFARFVAAAKPLGKSWLWPLWRYLRCVLASGAIGFFISATLGTHMEDADPPRGGGEVVAAPRDVQGGTVALKIFLGVLLPGLVGTSVGIREAERENGGRGY